MSTQGRRLTLLVAALAVAVLGVAAWRGWPHLRFWWLFEPLGLNAQGLPEYRHRQTGIVMVRVPGGRFWMGAQNEDPNGPNYDPDPQPNEGPVHEVELSPFLIGKYETSQAEWERVMESNPSYHIIGPDLPVETVSWNECQEFCGKAGLRLPTEAQWEYACRAGTTGPFAFGASITPTRANYAPDDLDEEAVKALARRKAVPVRWFDPNGFGLHQVHGNVWEWCEDVYDPAFYESPEACQRDPVCTAGSGDRVLRGGSWGDCSGYCGSADRHALDPAPLGDGVGVRAAYSPLP